MRLCQKLQKHFAWIRSLGLLVALAVASQNDAFAIPPVDPAAMARLNAAHHVVFDVRGSRGGNGDVAAGYLTAMEFFERYKYSGNISFVVDDQSRVVLEKLSYGNSTFSQRVRTFTQDAFPKNQGIDLYLSLAQPSGVPIGKFFNIVGGEHSFEELGIPIDEKTVLVSEAVLGNTEDFKSKVPYSSVVKNGTVYLKHPPGFAANETGVYLDFVAEKVRDMSRQNLLQYLESAIQKSVTDPKNAKNLQAVLRRERFQDAKFGLVYGVSHESVKKQFESYLRGLSKTGTSHVLLTPSGVSLKDISDPKLRAKVTLFTLDGSLPAHPAPGTISIVKTGALPHDVFVPLIAYSEIPPIVSGDGATSAAVRIGRPFVATRIQWNEQNLSNIATNLKTLSASVSPKGNLVFANLLDNIFYKSDLSQASKLDHYRDVFRKYSDQTRFLSDSILSNLLQIEKFESDPLTVRTAQSIDSALQGSLDFNAAMKGDRAALATVLEHLEDFQHPTSKVVEMHQVTILEHESADSDFLDHFLYREGFPHSRFQKLKMTPIPVNRANFGKVGRALREGDASVLKLIESAVQNKEPEILEILAMAISRLKDESVLPLADRLLDAASRVGNTKTLTVLGTSRFLGKNHPLLKNGKFGRKVMLAAWQPQTSAVWEELTKDQIIRLNADELRMLLIEAPEQLAKNPKAGDIVENILRLVAKRADASVFDDDMVRLLRVSSNRMDEWNLIRLATWIFRNVESKPELNHFFSEWVSILSVRPERELQEELRTLSEYRENYRKILESRSKTPDCLAAALKRL